MYKVGDKFIIEIEEIYKCKTPPTKGEKYLFKIKNFQSLVFDGYGMSMLTNYDPIEIEASVRQKIWNEGWNAAMKAIKEQIEVVDDPDSLLPWR